MWKATTLFAAGALALQAPGHEDLSFSLVQAEYLIRHENGLATFLDATKRSEDAEVVARDALDRMVGGDWTLLSRYSTKHNGVTHMAFRQMIHGIECENCDAVVNINSFGQVINIGHSAVKADAALRAEHYDNATVAPLDAVRAFVAFAGLMPTSRAAVEPAATLSGVRGMSHSFSFKGTPLGDATSMNEDVTAQLVYAQDGNKQPALAWRVTLFSEAPRYAQYVAHMTATGDSTPLAINDLVDWFANTNANDLEGEEYFVYDIPRLDPIDGERAIGRDIDDRLSPLRWHDMGNGRTFTDTRGNNVYSQENWNGDATWLPNYRPDGGTRLRFNFPIDFTIQPRQYADAAITNLHFWNNIIHDIFYQHGFMSCQATFKKTTWAGEAAKWTLSKRTHKMVLVSTMQTSPHLLMVPAHECECTCGMGSTPCEMEIWTVESLSMSMAMVFPND